VFAAEMSGVLDWFEWLEPFVGIQP
jgi:hypothetical protein